MIRILFEVPTIEVSAAVLVAVTATVVVEIMCASIAADVVALFSRAAIASLVVVASKSTHHFHRYTLQDTR
jgi:hypothetical protein